MLKLNQLTGRGSAKRKITSKLILVISSLLVCVSQNREFSINCEEDGNRGGVHNFLERTKNFLEGVKEDIGSGIVSPGKTHARQFQLFGFSNNEINNNHANSERISQLRETFDVVVPPYENYKPDPSIIKSPDQEVSHVIDRKRFIDSAPIRCMTSTFIDDIYAIEPNFALITPQNEVRLKATAPVEEILAAGFNPRKKTTILVHGFSQSYPDTLWLRRTRALFETNNYVLRQNLLIMDYGIASKQAYAQVAAMSSGIGAFLANFIMKLYEIGANPMDIHIVSHSLGSHIAGFAGKRLKPKIGRLTALDPAGPCFGKILYNHEQDRLTSNDAYMVDVLHYDDDFLGLPGQIGQFDVYVNGGHKQPGCKNNVNSMFQAMITLISKRKKVLSESHTRSTEVASTRLTGLHCQQVAYECQSYDKFMLGECGQCDANNNQCHLMTIDYQDSDLPELKPKSLPPFSTEGKKFFISTGGTEPFCLQHYQILIKFSPSPELAQQAKRNKWRVEMEALDKHGQKFSDVIILTNLMAPNIFSYLYQTQSFTEASKVEQARVRVLSSDGKTVQLFKEQSSGNSNPNGAYQLPFEITSAEVNFMSNIDPGVRQMLSSRLCPVGRGNLMELENFIDSEGWIHLEACNLPPM